MHRVAALAFLHDLFWHFYYKGFLNGKISFQRVAYHRIYLYYFRTISSSRQGIEMPIRRSQSYEKRVERK